MAGEVPDPVAIRARSDQEFIGVEVSLTVTGVVTTGDETTITADVGGKGYTGPSHFSFVERNGLVARMTIRQQGKRATRHG
jgi:hypothetical protein